MDMYIYTCVASYRPLLQFVDYKSFRRQKLKLLKDSLIIVHCYKMFKIYKPIVIINQMKINIYINEIHYH